MFYDLSGQEERRRAVFKKIAEYYTGCFAADGEWLVKDTPYTEPGTDYDIPSRERLWICIALLGEGSAKSVSAALAALEYMAAHGGMHGSFDMHAALNIYRRYGDMLSERIKEAIKAGAKEMAASILVPTCAYSGINDNFPSMDCFCGIIGGRLIGDAPSQEKGRLLMRELVEMLTRRGTISEYNSPTYTTINTHVMADLYELSDDEWVRENALKCEERIWADVLLHYHPNISANAGPYSRCYTVDDAAHQYKGRDMTWLVLGDGAVPVNPLNTSLSSKTGEPGEIMHNTLYHIQSTCAFAAAGNYHLPEYLARAAVEKPFPYRLSMTTESRARSDTDPKYPLFVYPGGGNTIRTYMDEEYALGTALRNFSSSFQTAAYNVIYRKRAPVTRQADIGTSYTKYYINDSEPMQLPAPGHDYKHHIVDDGRKFALQKDNTALVMYQSKHWADRDVRDMKLCIHHTAIYSLPEAVYVNRKKITTDGDGVIFECENPENVVIKDGRTFIGYRPLEITDRGRKCALKLEKLYGNLNVCYYNCEGEPRSFEMNRAMTTRNGFICEVRSEREIASADAMFDLLEQYEVEDRELLLDTNTWERYVTAQRPGLKFQFCVCMITEDIKFAAINGQIIESPVFSATGFDETALPYYDAGWKAPRGL